MKIIILILVSLDIMFWLDSQSQTLKETTDYIIEKTHEYTPNHSNTNDVMFKEQIHRPILKDLIGFEADDSFFNNICIYNNIQYTDDLKNRIFYSTYSVFDIRSMASINITRNGTSSEGESLILKIKLKDGHRGIKIFELNQGNKREYITEIKIFLYNNQTVVEKLKTAFIHLGSLVGVEVKNTEVF